MKETKKNQMRCMAALSGLLFIILISNVYAECQPDLQAISEERQWCSSECSKNSDLIAASDCVNACNGRWLNAQEQYNQCTQQEDQQKYLDAQAEQKRLEEEEAQQKYLDSQAEQKKLDEEEALAKEENSLPAKYTDPTYYRNGYAINRYEGEVVLNSDGVIIPINSDFYVFPGEIIQTGDGLIELASDIGTIQFGKNTLAEMLGIDPANSRVISSSFIDWDQDPNYRLELDEWKFWEDTFTDLGDFINKNRPTYLLSCAGGNIEGCAWGTAKFIYTGVGWFNDKIDKDFKKHIIVTPTAVITPDGTEFIVEVARDGATTVTTLNGTAIVMDLRSRKGVFVEANQKLIIPNTSTGLDERELQQSRTPINPESIDKWWINETDTTINKLPGIFSIISKRQMIFSIILVIIIFTVIGIIAKHAKKKNNP